MSRIADITPERAVTAVFFDLIDGGGYEYLTADDFDDEGPEDARADFANAIESTLAALGVPSNAENCGEAADIVLQHLPALARYLEDTTDR